VGTSLGAKQGLLIRGGDALEVQPRPHLLCLAECRRLPSLESWLPKVDEKNLLCHVPSRIFSSLVFHSVDTGLDPLTQNVLCSSLDVSTEQISHSVTLSSARSAWHALSQPQADMQAAAEVDTVVLDKTGTLTNGTPAVVRLLTAPRESDDASDLLRVAAAVEANTRHPIASALLAEAHTRGITPPPAADGFTEPGQVKNHPQRPSSNPSHDSRVNSRNRYHRGVRQGVPIRR
jgi:hypothetical protein